MKKSTFFSYFHFFESKNKQHNDFYDFTHCLQSGFEKGDW